MEGPKISPSVAGSEDLHVFFPDVDEDNGWKGNKTKVQLEEDEKKVNIWNGYIAYRSLTNKLEHQIKRRRIHCSICIQLVFFLTFFPYILYSQQIGLHFQANQAIDVFLYKKPFKILDKNDSYYITYDQISNEKEYYAWVYQIVIESVLRRNQQILGHNYYFSNSSSKNYHLNSPLLSWSGRFRSLRVKDMPCKTNSKIKDFYASRGKNCWPAFRLIHQAKSEHNYHPYCDTQSFTVRNCTDIRYRYMWHSQHETKESARSGLFADYPGSGFLQILPLNETKAKETVRIMENIPDKFIDGQTRAIFLLFTFYSPNINTFTEASFMSEISPTGMSFIFISSFTLIYIYIGAWHQSVRYTSQTLLGRTSLGLIVFSIVTLIYIFIFILRVFQDMVRDRKISFWIVFDLLLSALFVYQIYRSIEALLFNSKEEEILESVKRSIQNNNGALVVPGHILQRIHNLHVVQASLCGLMVFRTIKLLECFTGFEMVRKILSKAGSDLLLLFIMYGICFLGFGAVVLILYGGYLEMFSSYTKCLKTLVSMTLLEIPFYELYYANYFGFVSGPLFVYIFVCFFSLIFTYMVIGSMLYYSKLVTKCMLEDKSELMASEDQNAIDLYKEWEMILERFKRNAVQRVLLKDICIHLKIWIFGCYPQGFLSEAKMLNNLKEWKSHKQNSKVYFLNMAMIENAIKGDSDLVAERQMEELMKSFKHNLKSERFVQEYNANMRRLNQDLSTVKPSNMVLKRLQRSIDGFEFNTKKWNASINEYIASIRTVQNNSEEDTKILYTAIKQELERRKSRSSKT